MEPYQMLNWPDVEHMAVYELMLVNITRADIEKPRAVQYIMSPRIKRGITNNYGSEKKNKSEVCCVADDRAFMPR